jgi:hypothetical protein
MTGDYHVRFREGLGVKFPQATRLWHRQEMMEHLEKIGAFAPV